MIIQGNFNTKTVVANLVIINVLVFLLSYLAGKQEIMFCGVVEYVENLKLYGALHLPGFELFRPWQLVTYMFLHDGFMHILMNMFGLYMFGSALEQVWGPKRFLIFYFVCGIGAGLCYIAVQYYSLQGADEMLRCYLGNSSVVGASGSIFGILLAYAMLFPNTELMLLFFPVPIKAKYLVAGFGLWELVSGITNQPGDNVAHFAHLGGMLFAFILIKIWGSDKNNFY